MKPRLILSALTGVLLSAQVMPVAYAAVYSSRPCKIQFA